MGSFSSDDEDDDDDEGDDDSIINSEDDNDCTEEIEHVGKRSEESEGNGGSKDGEEEDKCKERSDPDDNGDESDGIGKTDNGNGRSTYSVFNRKLSAKRVGVFAVIAIVVVGVVVSIDTEESR